MTTVVTLRMPRLSRTMTEGTVLAWRFEVGAHFPRGAVLLEIETSKATVEWEVHSAGTLLEILVPAGSCAKVGEPLARILPD